MRLSTSHVGTSNRGCTPIALYPFGLHTEAKGGACATCAHAPAGDLCRRPNMGDHRRLRMLGALHAQTWVLPGTLWSTANQFAAVTMTVSERSTKSLASVRFWNCTSITGESWLSFVCGTVRCAGVSRCGDACRLPLQADRWRCSHPYTSSPNGTHGASQTFPVFHAKANRTPHGEGECGFHRSPRALALRITDGGRLPQT